MFFFFCAFRFLFIFFIKWDITVILQLRRGSKFGRLFERESDAAEFPFVICNLDTKKPN